MDTVVSIDEMLVVTDFMMMTWTIFTFRVDHELDKSQKIWCNTFPCFYAAWFPAFTKSFHR